MSSPLDGIISCKGFAYTICNKNARPLDNSMLIRLGTITGVIGSHIKIECLLGNSNTQGSTQPMNKIPLPTDPTNPTNAPILLTIYGSFHTGTSVGENICCNFEGFYTVTGKVTCINGVYVEYNSQYNYNVYLYLNSFDTNLNYFVYLPNNCTWVNDGNSYNGFINGEDSIWYEYQKL